MPRPSGSSMFEASTYYVESLGWAVTPLRPRSKMPVLHEWNGANAAVRSLDGVAKLWGAGQDNGIGLVHKHSGTGTFDIDSTEWAAVAFAEFGIEINELIADCLQVVGQPGHGKALFAVPPGLPTFKLTWPAPTEGGKPITVFELRAGEHQDVLPPSIHPDTGAPYTWAIAPWDKDEIPPIPAQLLAIWQAWKDFKPQFEAACPWAVQAEPPRLPVRQVGKKHSNLIGQFNESADVVQMLEANGYKPRGKRWLSPTSSTGIAGVVVLKDGRCYSHHASDPLNDGHAHDAFDLFCQFEHGGDFNRAIAAAGKMFRTAPGVTRAEVDISGLLAKATPGKPAAPDIAPHLLTVPGALRFAVEWSRATAKKPQPLFDVQAALALGSTVLGRRYRTDNDNWSALYFLNIAKSGAGKEHAKHAIETLLEAAGYGHLVGSGRFASESSIISALVGQPCHVAMLDEFGKSIEESNSAGNWMARGTLKGLIEVWGRAHSVLRPVAYSTAGMSSRQAEELAKRMVRKPSLTIQAMSTPETLFDAMTNKSAVDGFLNRFVTVFSDIGRQPPVPARFIEPPAQLIEWMHDTRNRGPGGNLGGMDVAHDIDPAPITLPIGGAAHQLFAAFGRECDRQADELEAEGLAEMTARNVEIAMRLSLIVAVSLGVQSVTFDAAQWAIDYVRTHSGRTITQLRINMSDGPFHRLYKAVLRLVAEAPASMGITTREIGRRCRPWNQVAKKMQDDCLAALMRDGYIAERQRESASGRGRTGIAYFLNTVDGVDIASTGDVDA
ncbi:MAG: bifunctional DNA primase/polymerase [Burkholderiaceae bacterium]|nr:bifunctional DNA primase/polymerase [Burkholderiaceae bacterium]